MRNRSALHLFLFEISDLPVSSFCQHNLHMYLILHMLAHHYRNFYRPSLLHYFTSRPKFTSSTNLSHRRLLVRAHRTDFTCSFSHLSDFFSSFVFRFCLLLLFVSHSVNLSVSFDVLKSLVALRTLRVFY